MTCPYLMALKRSLDFVKELKSLNDSFGDLHRDLILLRKPVEEISSTGFAVSEPE